ncbi:MAG: RnfABCDGE type electron transport complex subunit D [Bacteroidales bacterium]|jgi:electron transport complex protein RnfD|nr:RnfABCDGE type electron transport complex subunit D [Bacteroidales bacterium]
MRINKLTISMSPHNHGNQSVKKIMYGVIIAMLPALAVSIYYFGLDVIKINLIAIASCICIEWLVQKFLLKGKTTITDGSAVITGMLLAFNLPSNLPWWIIVIGAVVAIGIGKMTFGGLGNNPFNPALVGRVFLLISFPVQMTSWPVAKVIDFTFTDATTGATPLAIIKEGLKNGKGISELMEGLPEYTDMFMGHMGGSLGEISAIALIIGGIFMLFRKIISWHIPVAILCSVAIFTGILHGINPEQYASPVFHLLSGGLILGAIFMATDMVTSPMTGKGMLIYGVGIGVITVLIRTYGSYPEGVSFAILMMNAVVPLINNWTKPKRFGEIIKN